MSSMIIILYTLAIVLNIAATCLCFIVAEEKYVHKREVSLIYILLGLINFMFAKYLSYNAIFSIKQQSQPYKVYF